MIESSQVDVFVLPRQQKKVLRTILAVLVASVLYVPFGNGLRFANESDNPGIQYSRFSSAFIGSLLSGIFIDKIGRKFTIIMAIIFYLLGYIFALLSWPTLNSSKQMSTICSFVGGIYYGVGVGVTSLVVPIYIAEISSTCLRGPMGVTCNNSLLFGAFLLLFVELKLSNDLYFSNIIGIIIIVLSFLMILMPETPRWLLAQNRRDEALKSLLWLRGKLPDAEDECNDIQISVEYQQVASVNDYRSLGLFRPLFIGSYLCFIQQFIYHQYFFNLLNFLKFQNKVLVLPICLLLQTLLALLGCIFVHKFRRRHLLMSGSCLLFLYSIVIAIFYQIKQDFNERVISIYTTVFYGIVFTLSWGPLPWIIFSEIFPPRARGFFGSIAISAYWLLNIARQFFSNWLIENEKFSFWLLSGIYLISIPFIYFIVPETKGKTLEEIEHYYVMYRTFRNYLF